MRTITSLILIAVLLTTVISPLYVQAQTSKEYSITGAGATFPFPLIDLWRVKYGEKHPNISLNYQSIGSGGGVKQHVENTVNFGATDAPLTSSEVELASELNHDVTTWAIEQYHNLESQKNRLVEQLEKEESIQHKIAIEKLIFQINDKLSQFVSKMISSGTVIPNQTNEKEAMEKTKDFMIYILLDGKKDTDTLWTKDDLLFTIIKKYKCDLAFANSIFNNMGKLGSKLCETNSVFQLNEYETKYDVLKFAEMRDFLSDQEIQIVRKKIR